MFGAGLEPLAEVPAAVPEVASRAGAGRVALRPARGGGPGRRCPAAKSTQRFIESSWSASTSVRPVARYSSHGTCTAASPQPAAPWPSLQIGRVGAGVGDDVGDRAAVELVGFEVAQPLGGEVADVVEVGGGVDVELPVADPPGPLARGAVGGDLAGVAAEAPVGGAVEPVDALVGALEPADPRRGRCGRRRW